MRLQNRLRHLKRLWQWLWQWLWLGLLQVELVVLILTIDEEQASVALVLGGKVGAVLTGGHPASLGRHGNRFLVAVISAAGAGGVASVSRREPVVTVSCQPVGCVGKPVYHHQRLAGRGVSVTVAVAKAGRLRWIAGGWVERVLRQEVRS
jgi:hypothetical protein